MKIGIMGGTLDPVHNGHLQIAQAAMDALKLDRVMLLPAGDPPHKAPPTDKADRMAMARLAAASREGFFACGIEIAREGVTYTVDTLNELKRKNPHTQWVYLIGADTLDVLDSWRCFSEIAKLCSFAVVGRAEEGICRARVRALEEKYGAAFALLPVRGPDISSTEIRNRAAEGLDIRQMVPAAVADYIAEKGLYLCGCGRDELLRMLRESLKPSRYAHTLGVAETAVRLAARFGIHPVKAELAALLHDCAKSMRMDEMRALALDGAADVDADEMATVSVLHAPAGSVWARRHFGVRDAEILSAIRKHTLGAAQMSPLDALIYTADFIEPNRKRFPGLDEARELAETDLFAAMCKCAELTNDYLKDQGAKPHPRSVAMLTHYQSEKKEEKR